MSQITIRKDMVILSLVGKHMKNMVGIAGKMFRCVPDGTSDGMASVLSLFQ
jgi:aspartate kinase